MKTYTTSDFLPILKKLNSKLRVISNSDPEKLAGLYIDTSDGVKCPEHICGIDKNYLPEYMSYNKDGKLVKGGWRRVVQILLSQHLTSKQSVLKIWPNFFERKANIVQYPDVRPEAEKLIEEFNTKYLFNTPSNKEVKDYVVEASESIRKEMTSYDLESDDKRRFEFKKQIQEK